MTYQFYAARKEHALRQVPAVARASINLYFEWLKNLQPKDVVDGIEQGLTIEQARRQASIATRLGIATAKGILKVSKTMQQELKKVATSETTLMTLQYENPATYQVICSYGERGKQYVNDWISQALKMLGVV